MVNQSSQVSVVRLKRVFCGPGSNFLLLYLLSLLGYFASFLLNICQLVGGVFNLVYEKFGCVEGYVILVLLLLREASIC